MIVHSRATLSVYSDTLSVAEITRALGMDPHVSLERGAPSRVGLAGSASETGRMVNARTKWSYEADPSLVNPDDMTGFTAVQVITDAFRDQAGALRSLRDSCEIILWWSGDSDSAQGGFVIPAPLLSDLAAMGCDLYGTAFLTEDDG